MLADVLVHFDALDYIYTTICADEKQLAWMRHATKRALTVLNKNYGKMDESYQYRLAVLFHPSMRIHYLKQADWPQEWIDTTIKLTITIYEKFYKPAGISNAQAQAKAPSTSQFAYSSYMSQLYKTVASAEKTVATCPVCEFVNGAVVFDYDKEGEPVFCNPLVWWYNQRVAGNEWNRLTQMVLDILSMPATSVDVEHVFSFTGFTVGKRRHSLLSYSIQSTVMLGCYSKAGLVKHGCLVQVLAQAKKADKADKLDKSDKVDKGKSKSKSKPKPKANGTAKDTAAA
ncbi:hypothetical protein FRC08_013749 [Ceratobasidium sp. 394]|nr:hypothetical protein FRC08_013749 [Ceratobasidium sp. 394]KAG9075388.1 hypothetical protein FS749_012951 [Ceratobasidium sp. UAMH 11750]